MQKATTQKSGVFTIEGDFHSLVMVLPNVGIGVITIDGVPYDATSALTISWDKWDGSTGDIEFDTGINTVYIIEVR